MARSVSLLRSGILALLTSFVIAGCGSDSNDDDSGNTGSSEIAPGVAGMVESLDFASGNDSRLDDGDSAQVSLSGHVFRDGDPLAPIPGAHVRFFSSSSEQAHALVEGYSSADDGAYSLAFDKEQLIDEDFLLHVIADGYVTGVFVIDGSELLRRSMQQDFVLQAQSDAVIEPDPVLPVDGNSQATGDQTVDAGNPADTANPANTANPAVPGTGSSPGFEPVTGGGFNSADFSSAYASVPIHHLGDDRYAGLQNSRFQIEQAEGIRYDSPPFSLGAQQLAADQAYLTLLVKGSQLYNPVSVNGVEIGGLGYSSLNGAYTTHRIEVPVSLLAQENVISIQADSTLDASDNLDYDDFEFADIKLLITYD